MTVLLAPATAPGTTAVKQAIAVAPLKGPSTRKWQEVSELREKDST